MFFKKGKEKNELTAILCNSSIQTSELIEKAIKETEKYDFGKVYTTQFPWDALHVLISQRYDYLFIDEVTECNRNIEDTMGKISDLNNRPKIILLCNYVSEKTSRMLNKGFIDTYILMPFQTSHIIHAIDELEGKNSEIAEGVLN